MILDRLGELAAWLLGLQREVYAALGSRIQAMPESTEAALGAIAFALALGAVHAMTPGHGKAVIFSYFLGTRARPLSGIAMAGKVAGMHVLSAVLLVALFGSAASMFGRPAGVAKWVQVASYAIIVAIGAWLLLRALRGARRAGHEASGHRHDLSRGLLPFAIGLLPCPMTMLILTYALANASLGAGLVLVGFLGVGIAATIALVGSLGMLVRRGAFAVLDPAGRGYARVLGGLEIASCLAIVLLGAVFLAGAVA
jgi:ABC-type nickel/cobalt efflux system permease component RcnA